MTKSSVAKLKQKTQLLLQFMSLTEMEEGMTREWRMGAVATNFWAIHTKASSWQLTGKSNTRCFSNSVCGLQHREQVWKCGYSVRKIRCYFLPFEQSKSGKLALPNLWCCFDNRIKSKLSKPLVLVLLNSEITWWNSFFPSLCPWDHRLSLRLHSHRYH